MSEQNIKIENTNFQNITFTIKEVAVNITDALNFSPTTLSGGTTVSGNYLALSGGTMDNDNLVVNLNSNYLNGKKSDDFSLTGHNHTIADINDLQNQLNSKYNSTNPSNFISGITSGNVTSALGYTPYNNTNPNGFISGITSNNITSALGYTPYNSTNPSGYISGNQNINITGDATGSGTTGINLIVNSIKNKVVPTLSTGFFKYNGTDWTFDSNTYSLSNHNHTGTYESVLGNPLSDNYILSSTIAGVRSWIAPASGGTGGTVLNGNGFIKANGTSISYDNNTYLTGITSGNITSALGFTPYNSTNPSGYISGITKANVEAVLIGSISTHTHSYLTGITSSNVTTALGYTPYNATNPSNYISGITSGNITSALGFTPYNSTNPSNYISSITKANVETVLTGAITSHTHNYEPTIATGTTAQYLRGDKTFQTLNSTAVSLGNVTNDSQVKRSEMGVANGVATLDSSTKIPLSQIPVSLLGQVNYKGSWNASTNSPTLPTNPTASGDYYIVTVSGATSLGGVTDWKVGDWIIANSTVWGKVDNTDAVVTVNGYTGAVTLTSNDVTENSNLYYTEARVNANTNVAANTSARHTHSNLTALNNVTNTNTGDETTGSIKTKLGTGSTSTDGFITSIDWNTFNNKQNNLGYTPYNSTNPNNYISGITKANIEAVLTGAITSHSHSYLTGITSSNVTTALGFTPYNATNPSNYISSLTGAVLTSQATPQTIGDTSNRLTKLWATDLTVTNNITGSITGNAGTVTNGVYTTGAGTVYLAPTGSATGLTSFPTLNQNSTGSSATLTTARTLAGNSFNGSANVAFNNKFIVQGTTDAGLSGAQFLGSLGTGLLKNTTTTGVLSIASGADLPVMTATVGGAVPTPPNDVTKFLAGTGTWVVPSGGGSGTVTGTGTTNYISKFTGTTSVGNTAIYENTSGSYGLGIQTTNPRATLHVFGTLQVSTGVNDNVASSLIYLETLPYHEGLHIRATSSLAGGRYSYMAIEDETYQSVFKITETGRVGISTETPTAMLHLKAGTATANTAPLKFNSGSLLSAIEAGAVEFDGSHLYLSIGSSRYQLDQQTGSGSMVYPGTGLAVSTGSGWGTSLATTTVGGNLLTLANPSAITFPRFNANNTVSALSASDFKTAIGATGGGTVVHASGAKWSPADSTTYYWGSIPDLAPSATADIKRIYIPVTGTITRVTVFTYTNGTNSSDTDSIYLRLNNSSDTLISSSHTYTADSEIITNSSLSISITAGDYVEFKQVVGVLTTNPTNVYVSGQILIT